MEELIEKVSKFNSERNWGKFNTPENLAKSISIESSELLECFQWSNEYDVENVKDELADVLIYSIAMLNRMELDYREIILNKIEKNAKKYPIEKN